jgi:hypothetical protein
MESRPERNLGSSDQQPRSCRVDDACVITLQDMESPEDFLDTCHHVNQVAKDGFPRIVVDLSGLEKVYSPFLVYLAGFLRKQARDGSKVIVAGSTKAIKVFLRQGEDGGEFTTRDD